MTPARLSALAAGSLIAGFAVADVTGVRPLGGAVLLAGGIACARAALPLAGPGRTAAMLGVALAAFVASHPLGDAIGAWPAVLAMSAAVAAATAVLVQRD